jgi:secretion/DNA translocation related TadE-like protein
VKPAPTTAAERGAGSVLAVGVIAVVVLCLGLVAPLAVVLQASRQAAAAADAAALAGADTALGAAPGVPCDRARAVATSNGATRFRCRQNGLLVRVDLAVVVLGLAVPGAARAGPPSAATARSAPRALRGASDPAVYGVRTSGPASQPAAGARKGEGGRPCPERRSS